MLTVLCATLLVSSIHQKAPVDIPSIARVLKLAVGYSTVEDFERKLGPATHSVGGHPGGRRTWRDAVNHLTISLDGFDYTDKGRVVDDIEIQRCTDDSIKVKRIQGRKSLKDYAIYGGAVEFGMSREAALKAIRAKGWSYKEDSGRILLTAKGNVDFRGHSSSADLRSTHWRSQLAFEKGKLASVLLATASEEGD